MERDSKKERNEKEREKERNTILKRPLIHHAWDTVGPFLSPGP